MFIGHFGLAFGAKKAAPAVSLGALFLACQFADLLWPTLVLLGFERVEIEPGATAFTPLDFVSYPYSHSLVALCCGASSSAPSTRGQARARSPPRSRSRCSSSATGCSTTSRIGPTCR